MANDPTNTAPNVSVDGSIGWQGGTISIQHPLPGQVIAPSPTPAPAPTPPPAPPVKKTIPVVDLSSPNSGSYGVVHGDTLESIAAAHNTTVEQLKTLNPKLQAQTAIYPGQLLRLTSPAAAVAPQPAAIPAQPTVGPTQSTYTMANTHELEAAIHKELAGWAGAPGNSATDPAKNFIEATEKPKTETNPLKIEHK